MFFLDSILAIFFPDGINTITYDIIARREVPFNIIFDQHHRGGACGGPLKREAL